MWGDLGSSWFDNPFTFHWRYSSKRKLHVFGLSYEALTLSCLLVDRMKLSHCHVDWLIIWSSHTVMSTGWSYEALTLSCRLVFHMKLSHCHVDWLIIWSSHTVMSTGLSYEARTLSCRLVYHMKLSHCHVNWFIIWSSHTVMSTGTSVKLHISLSEILTVNILMCSP